MIPDSISRYSSTDHEVFVFGDKDKPKLPLGEEIQGFLT